MIFISKKPDIRDRILKRRVRVKDVQIQNVQEIVNNAIKNSGVPAWHSIPEPEDNLYSIQQALRAMKEGYEELQSIRGNVDAAAVTSGDLTNILELFREFLLDEADDRYASK